MIYVEKDVVNINRGDDGALTVPLKNLDKTDYIMDSSEYLIFGLREVPSEESELLLEINSEPGSNIIIFRHDDTKDMEVGFYSAEVQLMTRDNKRITVWPKLKGSNRTSLANRKNFCLMTEVVRT